MKKIQKITALLCALALAVSSFGTYADNAMAAGLPVTSDDAFLSQDTAERNVTKNTGAKANVQKLEFGKKTQGKLVSGDDGQQYQITLKSSGQLDIRLEGETGKLATRLTDKDGKGWAPRRKTAEGKQTYQLKKGTYCYQVQAARGVAIPKVGMDYEVTAKFKSAKAKFEDNNTRKKAAKLPLSKEFYGHLASNAPVEYYKFRLNELTYFMFSLTTQITDYTPETFEITLYNKYGKPMDRWYNPDWVEHYRDSDSVDGYNFKSGSWYYDYYYNSYDAGMTWILPAGDYYVGVTAEKDKTGKVPISARYGRYAAYATLQRPSVLVKLSRNQAEYTGKKIKTPKVTIKKQVHKDLERYSLERWRYRIEGITEGTGTSIKKIGRYRIWQNMWYEDPEFGPNDADAYAIFTVTPVRGKISRLDSKKKGQVQVSVKKDAQSTGYQIQVARDKKFKRTVKTLKTKNLKETLEGLSSGIKYYVRVRNYKEVKTCYFYDPFVDDEYNLDVPESIYGKWSKTKTVVCK